MAKIITFQKTFQNANAKEVLVTRHYKTMEVRIKTSSGNSGTVYVGNSGVSTDQGYEIQSAEEVRLLIDMSEMKEDLWAVASSASDSVSVLLITE